MTAFTQKELDFLQTASKQDQLRAGYPSGLLVSRYHDTVLDLQKKLSAAKASIVNTEQHFKQRLQQMQDEIDQTEVARLLLVEEISKRDANEEMARAVIVSGESLMLKLSDRLVGADNPTLFDEITAWMKDTVTTLRAFRIGRS